MNQSATGSGSALGAIKAAPPTAAVLAAAFLAILFILHFLEPEFDPSWRMISEYEIGQFGWLMSLAFFCWGGSALAFFVASRHTPGTRGGTAGRWWLLILGIAMIGAGVFKTNAITDSTPSASNTLHTLFGALVILTFPIAASLLAGSLNRNQDWASSRRQVVWMTVLTWVSMFAFFGSIIVSRMINPSAGRVGPDVFLGWPNRLMVTVYALWIIVVSLRLAANAGEIASGLPAPSSKST